MPTKQPSFLSRTTLGLSNYLLVAMATVFMLAMAPLGASKALRRHSNQLESWLPTSLGTVGDCQWFSRQFDGDQFVLISWDDCTLGKTAKLRNLARKLSQWAVEDGASPLARIVSGPELLEQLVGEPYNLTWQGAVDRLEGTFVGPMQVNERGVSLGQLSRLTCLAVYFKPEAAENDATVAATLAKINSIASQQCGIDAALLRMAGPALDSARISAETQRSILWLSALTVAAGFGVCCWRLRNVALAALAVIPAAAGGAATLAIVYYSGVLEVLALGRPAPLLGVADGLVLAAPLLVYALTLSASLRLIYHYRDARLAQGTPGAVEQAVADGWPAWAMAALLFAAVAGTLCLSELLPLRRFGLFVGLGIVVSIGAVLSIVPICLHRFPIEERSLTGARRDGAPPRWLSRLFESTLASHGGMLTAWLVAIVLAGVGIARLDSNAHLPAVVGSRSALAADYDWFSRRLAHPMPVEIVLTVPDERTRQDVENPEADGQQYRLSTLERIDLLRRIDRRINGISEISGSLSAAAFAPAGGALADSAQEAIHADLASYRLVRNERHQGSDSPTGRQLWRTTVRLSMTPPGTKTSYAQTFERLQSAVDQTLLTYERRDWLVRNLHERGSQLQGAEVYILFRGPAETAKPKDETPEFMLAELLGQSGVAGDGAQFFNLTTLDRPGNVGDALREQATAALRRATAVVLASGTGEEPSVERLAQAGVNVVNLRTLPAIEESAASPLVEVGGPRPIRAVYAGKPVLAMTVSRQSSTSLAQSWPVALSIAALAMMFIVWHPIVGLAAYAAALFPLAMALGAMGWLGFELDLAAALVIGLALGLALDGAIHYVAWFRRGAAAGLFRQEAARMAFARCAPAAVDAALAGGVSLTVLALSNIAVVQPLGLLALGVEVVSLIAVLLLLPVVMASPLARLMGAAKAPVESAEGLAPVRLVSLADGHEQQPPFRTDAAAASVPAPTHRPRPAVAANNASSERHDSAIDGPHAALHAKLQQLRRTVGD